MRIRVDPDSDPGQTLESQKVECLYEKYCWSKQGNRSKTYLQKYNNKAFLRSRKPGLFANFGQFPCSGSAFPIGSGSRIHSTWGVCVCAERTRCSGPRYRVWYSSAYVSSQTVASNQVPVPTYRRRTNILYFFWNFKAIQTESDTKAIGKIIISFFLFAKCLKMYWFLSICIPNLQ